MATGRRGYYIGLRERLPYGAERGLVSLIESENCYQNQVSFLRSNLTARYDFDVYSCYRLIDKFGSGIDSFALREFLKLNGHYSLGEDLDAIIRRLDIDGDGRISWAEFSQAVSGGRKPISLSSSTKGNRAKSSYGSTKKKSKKSTNKGSSKKKQTQYSPLRTTNH
jgi:hypothetical protein